jgi:hypothetical protein
MSERKALNLEDFDDFQVEPKKTTPVIRKEIDKSAIFPSRQAEGHVNLTVRILEEEGERFKRLCKEHRYPYGEMLSIFMDAFEGKKSK